MKKENRESEQFKPNTTNRYAMLCVMIFLGFTKHTRAQFGRSRNRSSSDERARIEDFYTKLDSNSNGQLEPAEYKSNFMRRTIEKRIREAGMDPDKPVTLSRFFEKRFNGQGSGGSRTSSASSGGTRRIYRTKSAHERLPKGIPQWFRDKDKNLDGQVVMSEYDTVWTDRKVAEFKKFDLNDDFVITPHELIAVLKIDPSKKRIKIATPSSDEPSTDSREVASKPPVAIPSKSTEPTNPRTKKNTMSADQPSDEGNLDTSRIDPKTLSYAQSVITKYDADKDGKLTPKEWSKFSKKADANNDGGITAHEYAASLSR